MAAAAAAAAIGDGIAIVGPAALPSVFNLYSPRNPRLCLALEPPRHDCIVFKAASSIDPYQRWEKVLLGDGSFELVNRHSGCSITIAHILPLLLDAAYFHPRVLGVPARWKAVVVHNATGEVVDGDMHIVCASALQNEILLLKIAQWGNEVVVVQAGNDDDEDDAAAGVGHNDARTSTASTASTNTRGRRYACFRCLVPCL